MTTEKQLYERLSEYASANGLKLSPNPRLVSTLIKGMLDNQRLHGELYCPCRRVTGNKSKDKRIVCPCIFHKREIRKWGHCYCGLFVKG